MSPLTSSASSSRALIRRRRGNRRTPVQQRPALVMFADGMGSAARGVMRVMRVMGKVTLALAFVGALGWGGRLGYHHVMASPRFELRDLEISPTTRLSRAEIAALAGVDLGDRLLAIDTDQMAARVAAHPWVASARVRRQLPAALFIDVTLRQAAAVVALGGLYLVDETGRPFKRATMEEAEGLPVFTGVDRALYVDQRAAVEAAFREALDVVKVWRRAEKRPALSEVNIDPTHGFTVFLLEGGAEVRLGRGDYDKKLARFDQILEPVFAGGAGGVARLIVVHLDGDTPGRVIVQLEPQQEPAGMLSLAATPARRDLKDRAATLTNTLHPKAH